jgi:NADPH-dependent 2,4-dienoyl-CoA reductase/sulfur reductase-like enzyme
LNKINLNYDVIVIGGGPAGLASAIQAKKTGKVSVLIIERDRELGGILPQCIHNGFGSVIFKKDYPGPYYAQKFIDEALNLGVDVLYDTMVLDITASKKVYASSCDNGYLELQAKSIILAMGCRERTRSQIRIPGTRPAGVFTAGTVQRMINIEGLMPGSKFVILGSGDIGMIMARRLTLEGAEVERVLEIMPFLTGLRRNFVQCLQDYNIKLELQHTVNRILGKRRVEGIETIKVDNNLNKIKGTEEYIECDTLLLSVGLIPENELSVKAQVDLDPVTNGPIINEKMETSNKGIFACGNVVSINDLVDYVSLYGYIAGKNAALYALNKFHSETGRIKLLKSNNIHSVIPQYINTDIQNNDEIMIQLRVNKIYEEKIIVEILKDNQPILSFKENYARPAEMIILKIKGKDIVNHIKENCMELFINLREA